MLFAVTFDGKFLSSFSIEFARRKNVQRYRLILDDQSKFIVHGCQCQSSQCTAKQNKSFLHKFNRTQSIKLIASVGNESEIKPGLHLCNKDKHKQEIVWERP